MVFDLQRFDDEQTVQSESQPAPETTNAEPIPEELGGLDEDTAREAMAEWEAMKSSQKPEQDTPAFTNEDYQAKVNENEQLKAELEKYRQQQPARTPARQAQFQVPPIKLTPEITAKINEAVKAEAMSMTGFTKDDVESLDYADDDDPRLAQWSQAKNMAQANVIAAIRDAQAWQQQRAQQLYDEQTAAINTYNEFAQKEMAAADFPAIQQYAMNEFFTGLAPNEQKIVANSYLRIERQTASPAEMLVVKNYYEKAKASFHRRNESRRAPANHKAAMPRVDQVHGTAGLGEITASELENMLNTTEFDKIPESYQKRLLGY